MKKKEHFVPQFYLKNFVNTNGFLDIYDCNTSKFKEIRPNNICYENYLYETKWCNANKQLGEFVLENSIENIFMRYEKEFAELLKKIFRICNPSQNRKALILRVEEKDLLCRFIANLYLRNPVNMQAMSLDTLTEDIRISEEIELINTLFERMGFGQIDSLCVAAQKNVMLTEELEGSLPQELQKNFRKIDFRFYYANEQEFITSDAPVCIGNDQSIQAEHKICIYLALTPKIAVLFGNYKESYNAKNRMLLIDAETVDEFNLQFIRYNKKNRFLIGRSKEILKRYLN